MKVVRAVLQRGLGKIEVGHPPSKLVVAVDGILDQATATDPANVEIVGADTGLYAGSISLSLDAAGSPLTIELDPPLPDQDCFTVSLSGMTSTAGADLLNPTFTVRTLAGDTDQDNLVEVGEMNACRNVIGQTADESNFLADWDCDGLIEVGDMNAIRNKIGKTAADCS